MNQVVHNAGRVLRGLGCSSTGRGLGDDVQDTNQYDGSYFNSYDASLGIWYDEYGNAWDVIGSGIFSNQDLTPDATSASGDPVLQFQTYGLDPAKQINLASLGSTPDWWEQISGDPAPPVLPAITYNAGYILATPSTVLASDPNAPAALKSPATWDKIKKALAAVAKKTSLSAGSGSGAAGGSRPQAVAPNPSGSCPAGYQKNATGQCVLATNGSSLLQNPMFLMLGAIGLIVLARR